MSQSVNVVIATFRRPDRLRDALRSIATSSARAPKDWRVGVTLVDDDPAGSAAPVAAEFADVFALGCTYLPCGGQNISDARNVGLESALPDADYVGSIDDDVVVPPQWVEVCAAAVSDGRHNAVTGPLIKDFSNGPAWLTQEPFDQFGVLAGVDGEDAFVCATGNNWMSAEFLRDFPSVRFSHDLGRTGGEDMDFFYRAVGVGLRPVFSWAAAVTETEPPARCTLRYQVRRAFWLGISEAQISQRLGLASRKRLLARATRRIIGGGSRQLPTDRVGDRGVRYALAVMTQSTGTALGALGMTLGHR